MFSYIQRFFFFLIFCFHRPSSTLLSLFLLSCTLCWLINAQLSSPSSSHSTSPFFIIISLLLFLQHRGKGVLIISYETQRRYSKMFEPAKVNPTCSCDLLICDEVSEQLLSTFKSLKSLNCCTLLSCYAIFTTLLKSTLLYFTLLYSSLLHPTLHIFSFFFSRLLLSYSLLLHLISSCILSLISSSIPNSNPITPSNL